MQKLLFSLSHKIGLFATTRNILILLACWIGFQIILGSASDFIAAESQGANVLDLGFDFAPEKVYSDYLDKYSAAARSYYLKIECLDLIYPICYGLLFSCLISLGFRNTKLHYLNLLPIFAICCDYLENIGIFALLLSYPQKMLGVATYMSVFRAIKWGFAFLAILAMLGSLGKILLSKIMRR